MKFIRKSNKLKLPVWKKIIQKRIVILIRILTIKIIWIKTILRVRVRFK
jgi:hypothetical protein